MLIEICLLCANDSLKRHYDGVYECSECGWSIDEVDLEDLEENRDF